MTPADLPRMPRRGEPLDAIWGQKVFAAIRAARLFVGAGLRARYTPEGVFISASPVRGGGGRVEEVPVPATPYDLTDYAVEPLVYRVGVRPFWCNGAPPTLGGTALDAATAPSLEVVVGDLVYLKVVGTFGTGSPPSPDTYVQTIEKQAASSGATLLTQELTAGGFIGRLPLGGVVGLSGGRLVLTTRGQSAGWSRIEADATSTGVYFWSF